MKKLLTLGIIGFFLLNSCSEDTLEVKDVGSNNKPEANEGRITPRLAFTSEQELQDFLDNVNTDVMNLKKGNIASMLKSTSAKTFAVDSGKEFISFLDSIRNNDLKDLTLDDWNEINSDEEELVYIPEDSLILDPSFASVLNYKRKIQVSSTVYRYMEEGIYSTHENNAILLEDLDEETNLKSARVLDSRITFYPADNFNNEEENIPMTKANISLSGTSLTLENGVVIPANKIRDLNYKDRGDSNWITNAWTGIWGKNIVAINKYNSKKKMIVTFYDQDYLIYKNIGTQAKMQKKKLWIWWEYSCR
jgi:hypothetical protein